MIELCFSCDLFLADGLLLLLLLAKPLLMLI